jgi:hypothetical protein
MADFDVLYPARKKIQFDGGKNSKYQVQLIDDNESPDCLNVRFEQGAVETRGGTSKLNTATVGSLSADGLYTRHDRSGTESMCAWFAGSLYVVSGTSFHVIPSATSIYTAGQRVGSTEYENYIFFGNGGTLAYKYASGDFTRHGVYPPISAPALASNSTGALSAGTYVYKTTYVNSALVEGDVGLESNSFAVSAGGGQINVSSIPTGALSYGVARRKLYRSYYSGATWSTFALVTTINDNSTTTYTDNIANSALGADAPTDQGVPPLYSTIITHQNRLFCNDTANPQLVWYSELDTPYTFEAANFIRVGDDSGDLVRSFAVHDNGLVVFTDNSAYMIYMPTQDPSGWSLQKLRSSYGSKSPFGNFSYENKIMFPAVQNTKLVGFAAIEGNGVDPEATLLTVSAAGSEMKSDRIEPDIFNIQTTPIARISSIVFKNKAFISVTYESPNTTNNRVYTFDFSIGNLSKNQKFAWSPDTGTKAEQFCVFGGSLYYQAADSTGYVYRMEIDDTFSDAGTAINSYYWTKEFYGLPGHEQYVKDFRYVNILYSTVGAYFMNFTYRVDSDKGDGNTITIDLDPGGSLWGTMVWGVDNWGGGTNQREERIYLGQLRGKRVQFKFSNQNVVSQGYKIIGMQIAYNIKGKR